jgi:hypothetical protein
MVIVVKRESEEVGVRNRMTHTRPCYIWHSTGVLQRPEAIRQPGRVRGTCGWPARLSAQEHRVLDRVYQQAVSNE